MKVKVTGCKDCILAEYQDSGSYRCIHPHGDDYIPEDENENVITPDWCPLNKEPITIEKV